MEETNSARKSILCVFAALVGDDGNRTAKMPGNAREIGRIAIRPYEYISLNHGKLISVRTAK